MKKFLTIVSLALPVFLTAAATIRSSDSAKYTNLKVLPKNISSRDLQSIMADDFEDGLGVSCGFCHANAPDGHGLDFASDTKPEKAITRTMMRMTLDLNKRWLQNKHPRLGDPALVVQCSTCHKGQAFPYGAEPQ
ncbi:c-type cytochrome [Mucilaginibacter rubeus]|uniref:Photosynthetic reaction center cytochrome c subunit n=1 Tax=Mucilaginibacter rubeus TaxID=2027860 RepID=A0AAE6JCZ6_9SPHI|nr:MULTISPECIES: c-type cytochrome [Mucilaginibacter]QEM02537.1 c-type cytochrome [Mucilaginibacter rubeus]QEM15157.1 c-type cytochrome [Mucilaginibacter gossypii]QTE42120.1 c-type cytochrome [Mucilaginibacter rubeus]QTE48721.1 c-type cytochrome [Mucilaginibacter rubeus]QTE53819.1 c-type cytochrome [Mucilaginibacter rubeus]